MARFDRSHYVEILQGAKKLSAGSMRKVLASRAAFLARDIERRVRLGKMYGYQLDELRALVQVFERCAEVLGELGEITQAA